MVKYICLLGLMVYSLTLSFAQNKIIMNQPSEQHIAVEGTRVSMIPPEEFTQAEDFKGFAFKEKQASILVIEFPGPFGLTTSGFTKDNLASRGMLLIDQEEIQMNGKDALMVKVQQFLASQSFIKWILAFGDEEKTVMINGTTPEDYVEELAEPIRQSLLSTVYEENKILDPLSEADFTVDISSTKLKFANGIAGMLMFTADGLIPTQSQDKTLFIVGASMGETKVGDPQEFARQRIHQYPNLEVKTVQEQDIQAVTIDGLSGYEIYTYGWNEDAQLKELLYQLILYQDQRYYIMLGTAQDAYDENLNLFKALAHSFKLK